MYLSKEQLVQFFEGTSESTIDQYIEPLEKVFEQYNINTPARIAMFLAQVGHESGGLRVTEENLNYRPERLAVVFPKYFKNVDVKQYAHNPEKIANRVYANRMGNGDEASGDGYRYRGRGLIQLTGKNNYERFADDIGMSLEDVVEYLTTPEGAAMSAGWFWNSRNINDPADNGDCVTCTKLINGGTIGLQQRQEAYQEALCILED